MFERRITKAEIESVLKSGTIIEDYPDDLPYPSRLILGWCNGRPIHVVAARNIDADEEIIVTVYEPESILWTADFTRRKP